MSSVPFVHAHGAAIPSVGLGTWTAKADECIRAVTAAIAGGYRHIDTAAAYGNEEAVGEALRASGVPREEIFVTTKVWYENIGAGDLERAAEDSLKRLGLERVDLLLIHWPNAAIPLKDSIAALCDAKRRGLTHHIGVSNFTVPLLDQAVRLATEPLATNQCEYHPRLDQSKVIEACRAYEIAFTSYSPLGRGDLLADPVIIDIARAHGRTPAQIVLRWHVQQPGVVTIPKSASPERIAENIAIFDFELSHDDMGRIFGLARPNGRMISPAWAPQWDAAA